MAEILTIELKHDLQNIYKLTGDLLNLLTEKDFSAESKEMKDLMDMLKFRLEDMEGTLQKDIFNCDYLLSKIKMFNELGGDYTKTEALIK